MITEAFDWLREAARAPLSGRVPLPVERHEGEAEAGEQPQHWEADILALRLATVTREPR